ncbi:MAG: hypothetical protein J0H95_10785 [Xanthomonadales bacterium]|nr:hypothetical protein [Xanthomonadales bacterium]MBN8795952.1 hypothetical protein [Stenotrophomonas nitritireducens]
MSESQEHPLPLATVISLRMHLVLCSGCRNFDRQLGVLRQATRAFARGADEKVRAGRERKADEDEER